MKFGSLVDEHDCQLIGMTNDWLFYHVFEHVAHKTGDCWVASCHLWVIMSHFPIECNVLGDDRCWDWGFVLGSLVQIVCSKSGETLQSMVVMPLLCTALTGAGSRKVVVAWCQFCDFIGFNSLCHRVGHNMRRPHPIKTLFCFLKGSKWKRYKMKRTQRRKPFVCWTDRNVWCHHNFTHNITL